MIGAAFGFLPTDSFNVVVLVAVFVLISLGLHFTFGLLNVVNLMHGEFLLLGAYTAFEIQSRTGNVVLGMLVAPIVGVPGVFGAVYVAVHTPFVQLKLPSVPAEALGSLADDQICYGKDGGGWKIVGYVGGNAINIALERGA